MLVRKVKNTLELLVEVKPNIVGVEMVLSIKQSTFLERNTEIWLG